MDFKNEYKKYNVSEDTSTKGCGWLIAIFIISLIISIIISL